MTTFKGFYLEDQSRQSSSSSLNELQDFKAAE